MHLKFLSFAALATLASAQSLTSVLSATPQLSNLTTYVTQFPDLLQFLEKAKDITILAPTNAAFDQFLKNATSIQQNPQLLEAVLTYHVLQARVPASSFKATPAFIPTLLTTRKLTNVTGGQVVEGVVKGGKIEVVSGLRAVSTVVKGDVAFDGGLVHIIDHVLTVPPLISTTALIGGLTGIASALESAGLVHAIDTTSDLTVFAPDNAAFQKVASQVSKLTAAQLATVLGYHVVKGPISYSSTLKNGQTLTTTTGQKLTITISGGNVFVNDAQVLLPDTLVANGVVHVIDRILSSKSSQTAGGSYPTGGAGTPTATGSPTGATGTGVTSYPPTGSPITPYIGAGSSTKTGVLGLAAFLAASFWLTI